MDRSHQTNLLSKLSRLFTESEEEVVGDVEEIWGMVTCSCKRPREFNPLQGFFL